MATLKAIGVLAALFCVASASGAGMTSSAEGVYTTAQAERGLTVYADHCLRCHGEDLETARGGTEYGIPSPPLAGRQFLLNWDGKGVDELFTLVQTTMPKNVTSRLKPEQYADVVAFLLQQNEFPEGDAELPPDPVRLKAIRLAVDPLGR
jgi:polar amino acid transport system substrate-binding protein